MTLPVPSACRSWAALSLAAIACANGTRPESGDVPATYGEPFELAAGESALVGEDFHVTFVRVSEDSRCAEGGECAEPGSVAVVLAVEGDSGSATLTLHTGREPRRATAAGRTVELVGLWPAAGPRAEPERYQVTLAVTRTR